MRQARFRALITLYYLQPRPETLLLATTVTLCVVIGRRFQLTVSVGDAIAISVAPMLIGLDFAAESAPATSPS